MATTLTEALIIEQLTVSRMPNLRRAHCGGLFALSGALLYLQTALIDVDPFIFMLTVLTFAVAIVSVTVNNRWALVLGISFTVFVMGANAQEFLNSLLHPESAHLFGFITLLLTIVSVTIVSGILSILPGKRDVSDSLLIIILLCLAMFNIGAATTAYITVQPTHKEVVSGNR